jgi:hypothetical protein
MICAGGKLRQPPQKQRIIFYGTRLLVAGAINRQHKLSLA